MAVFCDLEDDDSSSSSRSHFHAKSQYGQDPLRVAVERGSGTPTWISGVQNIVVQPWTTYQLAAVLTCYPVALSLAAHLDLNDLHALAATCRSVHTSLTQYAYQLKSRSLRCIHDEKIALAEALSAQNQISHAEQGFGTTTNAQGVAGSQMQASAEATGTELFFTLASGAYISVGLISKIGSCARDLVAPCRKCGTAVCRNCAAKPPSNIRLKERLRRLCKTCLDAPIQAHFQHPSLFGDSNDGPPASSASSMRSERSFSGSSISESTCQLDLEVNAEAFTSSAFLRDPCVCDSRGVFLCAPCGSNLHAGDTTYQRVFTWRSRYSTRIGGGLGTGLGLGNQGQKCGRGETCLDTSAEAVCWVEIDCSDGIAHDAGDHEGYPLSRVGTPDSSNKPGYLQQEVVSALYQSRFAFLRRKVGGGVFDSARADNSQEGIGGVLKKKVKRRVKTGAYTYEYADERESGRYLEREHTGAVRSWCGWCARIVPSVKERGEAGVDPIAV